MSERILLLPGDGIGPEIVAEALKVLEALQGVTDARFDIEQASIGGNAVDAHGVPLPGETLERARLCDAVLLGAVGGRDGTGSSAPSAPNAVCSRCGPSSGCSRTSARRSRTRSSPAHRP